VEVATAVIAIVGTMVTTVESGPGFIFIGEPASDPSIRSD
jgi:hypothetical protein